jgi:tubulin polyglutamylase TTLL11
MARFCTEKYQKPTAGNMTHLYSHLTNYSLNKGHSSYIHANTLKDQLKGIFSVLYSHQSVQAVKDFYQQFSIRLVF